MAALFGCGSALVRQPPITPSHLAHYNSPGGDDSVVVGTVSAEPVRLDTYQRVRLAAEEIRPSGEIAARRVEGDLIALLPRYPIHQIGERLSLSGTLTEPPTFSSFNYAAYLARQGVHSYMRFPRARSLNPSPGDAISPLAQVVGSARERAREALRKNIPEPQAALAVGVVVGDRSSLPPGVEEAFRRSGTTHVLAISGQNIALIVGFIWLAFGGGTGQRRLPGWLVPLVLVLLAFYTLFTGANVAVVRASTMASVLIMAPVVGRRYDPVAALAVTAFLMALLDPDTLFDAGFQLSFGALLGMTLISPLLYRGLTRLRVPGLLALIASASLGAQAATIPLSALLTGGVSLVSLFATVTIDVMLLPLMLTGIATVLLDFLLPGAGAFTGLLAWMCASWMTWWVSLWSSLPVAYAELAVVPAVWILLYYVTIFGPVWFLTGGRKVIAPLFSCGRVTVGMGVASLVLWLLAFALILGKV
jgi:competence protein ComEC